MRGSSWHIALRPILFRGKMKELHKRCYALCLAPCREHVVRKMVAVVFSPVVWAEEDLNAAPRGLYGVCMRPVVRIDEPQAMVDGAVRVTLVFETMICRPAIADDCSAGFDPVTYYVDQRVGGSVRYGNKECPAGPSFDTAKHPLTLNRVTPMIFSPTELALINFDGFVRTTDLNRAALHEEKHNFPTEHAPISNCMCTVAMFMLNSESRFAAHDAIHN